MKKVTLKVNGLSKQVVANSDLRLLDYLRDELSLTGAKQSCDRAGQCGACTVIVNGRAIKSCLSKVANLDGADIITVEGLGTPENPHLIQEAFVLAGAIQCGFCTPGMIMAAKALLDREPNPSTDDIKNALRGVLCRCTGYVKIIEAVKLAGRFIRGEITPDDVRPDPNGPKIGVSHPRPTAMVKACGTAQFTADIKLPGAAEVAVVRSPHGHALIKGIDYSAAEKLPGVFGVMTAKDIKGTNMLKSMAVDRPLLCGDKVRSIGDPVAIVVAETQAQALAAAKAVKVDYELLPTYWSPKASMAPDAIEIHVGIPNVVFKKHVYKGDAEKAVAQSPNVVKATFNTQLNHQAPLEPEACVAYFEGEGEDAQLVVIGRSINIHGAMHVVSEAIGFENMRYLEAFTGGNFGIKDEITSEGVTAAAAMHFKCAVRYIPSLAESMVLTSKRHPYEMELTLGADKEGRITGMLLDATSDNGAYTSIGAYIVIRAASMCTGSYFIPHLKADFKLVYTNNNFGGAARGAGPPQVAFALESAVDMLADKMGIDPLEFRMRNTLKPGQMRSMGKPVTQWPFVEVCEALKPHYERALAEAKAHKSGVIRRGVGISGGSFGIGGAHDRGIAAVEMDADNGITVYAGAADPGEGNDSMFTQIAADMLNLPLYKIRLITKDTDRTTATGPAAGSRITIMVGGAMVNAIEQLQAALAEVGGSTYEDLIKAGKPTRYVGTHETTDDTPDDPITGNGGNFDTEVQAAQLAEVEVNTETGEVKVLKITNVVDPGIVINPNNLVGQIEGGNDQGAGFALREQFIPGETKDWKTFKFPTMATSFEMETILRETPRERATRGSTGVGEMTLMPTAPAVLNAIEDACGARIYDLPATPEKIKAALGKSK